MQRVGPVLDPQVAAEQRVVGVGDVPGRVHVGTEATHRLVDDDPVVDPQPRRLGQIDIGADADAHDDEVGENVDSLVGHYPGDVVAGAGQFPHSRAQPQVYAVLAVQAGEHPSQLVAECGAQRRLLRLHDGHVVAVTTARPPPPRVRSSRHR